MYPPYLDYHFWQEIFVESPNGGKQLAYWCGPTEKQGDFLTYHVLLRDTEQLVPRSNVRPAKDSLFPNRNQHQPPADGDTTISIQQPVIHTVTDFIDDSLTLPQFSPDELIGMSFVRQHDGHDYHAKVIRKVLDRDARDHQEIKFLLSLGDGELEELIAYNKLSDLISEQDQAANDGHTELFGFDRLTDHQGPLKCNDPRHKGSSWNAYVHWDDGSATWEPLNEIAKFDPVTVAMYAHEHGLLNTLGWRFLQQTAKRQRFINVAINNAKRRSNPKQIRYKFGVKIPRSYAEALKFDHDNGNTLWQDAVALKLKQILDYNSFRDLGHGTPVPHGYTQISVQFVFDAKEDGCRKARIVAHGDFTPEPDEAVYSSVASLHSLHYITFIAELNGHNLMQGDIGNAYLESYTQEKVCFTAGPEFGPLAGHTLVIIKALYGLRSSGLRFHEKLADTLRTMGFFPSYADPDVWMRAPPNPFAPYKYIVVYVDDLFVAMKDPLAFLQELQTDPWNYKLKGVGPPRYHLGVDFFRDSDGTLCMGTQTYAKRLLSNFEKLFGTLPPPVRSPLPEHDRPELDDTPLCGPDDVAKYQSILGACQWMISLVRFDLCEAIMSLSRFRHCPRRGHLDRLKRVCGYIRQFPHCSIRFRTHIPPHEAHYTSQPTYHEWMDTVYGPVSEELPANMPSPRGRLVRTTTFFDANLMHDVITGRSCTGVLHLLNQTPSSWFSSRQGQVETATYGSEFMAARQAVEQIIDIRYTLRMFGVPLDGPAWLLGDNQAVINSTTIPHSSLSKCWNALSYHRCREAVAAGIVRFEFLPGHENPSDILTKNLPWAKARVFVEPLLLWKGETVSSGTPNQRGVTG